MDRILAGLCVWLTLGVPAFADNHVTSVRPVIGEEISLPIQGWYMNVTKERADQLILQAREDNNRIEKAIGYYVDGIGPRFILRVVDQPSRMLGLNPNWASWRVRLDLTHDQMRGFYQDLVIERFYSGMVDSYYTPEGIRYAFRFRRFQDNVDQGVGWLPGAYRIGRPPVMDLAVPASLWRDHLQRRARDGYFPDSITSAFNEYGEVEFSATFGPPGQNIIRQASFQQAGPDSLAAEMRARRSGLQGLRLDMLPARRGDTVRYSSVWHDEQGHFWDSGHGARQSNRASPRHLMRNIPRRELAARLGQIQALGRYVYDANAVQRYHGGGSGNDVVFALVISGTEPLPPLPPGPEAAFVRLRSPRIAMSAQAASALDFQGDSRRTLDLGAVYVENVAADSPISVSQYSAASANAPEPVSIVRRQEGRTIVLLMDAEHLTGDVLNVQLDGDGSVGGELIASFDLSSGGRLDGTSPTPQSPQPVRGKALTQ